MAPSMVLVWLYGCHLFYHAEALQSPRLSQSLAQVTAEGTLTNPASLQSRASASANAHDSTQINPTATLESPSSARAQVIGGSENHAQQNALNHYFNFGGTLHSGTSNSWSETKFRPEEVKSYNCVTEGSTRTCSSCEKDKECWSGKEMTNLTYMYGAASNAVMSLDVNGATLPQSKTFEMELWLECTGQIQGWPFFKVKTAEGSNGAFKVFVEEGELKSIDFGSGGDKNGGGQQLDWDIPVPSVAATQASGSAWASGGTQASGSTTAKDEKSGQHVRIVWEPKDPTKASWAWVQFYLLVYNDGDPYSAMDMCMSRKNCLEKLDGDGSEAGYLIRNSNTLQLTCLQTGTLAGQSEPAIQKCKVWNACLTNEGQMQHLQHLLAATETGSTASMAEAGAGKLVRKRYAEIEKNPECVDPYSSDPESWDCDCFQTLEAKCPSVTTPDLTSCYHAILCKAELICDTWKAGAGCPNAGASLLRRSAAAPRRKEEGSTAALDETMSDKCIETR